MEFPVLWLSSNRGSCLQKAERKAREPVTAEQFCRTFCRAICRAKRRKTAAESNVVYLLRLSLLFVQNVVNSTLLMDIVFVDSTFTDHKLMFGKEITRLKRNPWLSCSSVDQGFINVVLTCGIITTCVLDLPQDDSQDLQHWLLSMQLGKAIL
ncbi:uncharacterized protein [Montipora capricornis]|uniref:uncharacterized protein n=1 Tax=Montipora capricornis TaxID=246305 RepID=UPI0035F1CACC